MHDDPLGGARVSQWGVSEQLLETLIRHAPMGIAFLDLEFRYLLINDNLAAINGLAPDAHLGRRTADVVPEIWPQLRPHYEHVRATGEAVTNIEITGTVASSPGVVRHWFEGLFPVRRQDGTMAGIGIMVVELTEQKRAEAKQRAILAAMPDFIFDLSRDGTHLSFHAPQSEALYVPPDRIVGRTVRELLPGRVADQYERAIANALATGEMQVFEYQLDYPTGTRTFDSRMVRKGPDETLIMVRDITDMRVAEQQRQSLEEQFRQAQKMEAVGQLAGGVAHDFNNLLTVIHGCSELALTLLPLEHPARQYLTDIQRAGEHAGTLTRQLLLFSRQQVLEPRVLNINQVVTAAERMLRRLVGEDIEVVAKLDPALSTVTADPGQIEQVLLNLCVNARDAMPQGGRIIIETSNVSLDAGYARSHAGVEPGRYCMLSVSDTGTGMDPATRARVFEPFFTTKPPGKGTGLGLAVVFGVVKQSRGHIDVYTEPGHGTAFKLYLPPAEEAPSTVTLAAAPHVLLPPGTETVLLAEDDDNVRSVAREILEQCGYTVLAAADGLEALMLLERHPGSPHILISDVVMPHLGGRQLAEAVIAKSRDVKVLLLSGYTDDVVIRHGGLPAGFAFLQKPFTMSGLAIKVREVLDKPQN